MLRLALGRRAAGAFTSCALRKNWGGSRSCGAARETPPARHGPAPLRWLASTCPRGPEESLRTALALLRGAPTGCPKARTSQRVFGSWTQHAGGIASPERLVEAARPRPARARLATTVPTLSPPRPHPVPTPSPPRPHPVPVAGKRPVRARNKCTHCAPPGSRLPTRRAVPDQSPFSPGARSSDRHTERSGASVMVSCVTNREPPGHQGAGTGAGEEQSALMPVIRGRSSIRRKPRDESGSSPRDPRFVLPFRTAHSSPRPLRHNPDLVHHHRPCHGAIEPQDDATQRRHVQPRRGGDEIGQGNRVALQHELVGRAKLA